MNIFICLIIISILFIIASLIYTKIAYGYVSFNACSAIGIIMLVPSLMVGSLTYINEIDTIRDIQTIQESKSINLHVDTKTIDETNLHILKLKTGNKISPYLYWHHKEIEDLKYLPTEGVNK